jgi:hypothetical protein
MHFIDCIDILMNYSLTEMLIMIQNSIKSFEFSNDRICSIDTLNFCFKGLFLGNEKYQN